MENASKALIIAGAILISILIIGLGVFIFNQASETAGKVNLGSHEAQAQNKQFEAYFGERKNSSDVKALMSLIRSNNITGETGDETKYIYVYHDGFGQNAPTDKTPSAIAKAVKPGKTYKIEVQNDNADDSELAKDAVKDGAAAYYKSGYIKIIKVTQN